MESHPKSNVPSNLSYYVIVYLQDFIRHHFQVLVGGIEANSYGTQFFQGKSGSCFRIRDVTSMAFSHPSIVHPVAVLICLLCKLCVFANAHSYLFSLVHAPWQVPGTCRKARLCGTPSCSAFSRSA